jgi:Domain of unknown function (DUF1839)
VGTLIHAIPGLSADGYVRHELHRDASPWVEKNCYVDVWIELLHALRLEPLAMLSVSVGVNFDGDQWTFLKPSHSDLWELYGLDVQEFNVWRPLVDHAVEYLRDGRLISTEADAFWLPDTAGTDYRRKHTKSTIVLAEIDVPGERLGYFHNGGYFALTGDDFRQTFRLDREADATWMPLFAEAIRIRRAEHRTSSELRSLSRRMLQREVERRPISNPFRAFEERWRHDLAGLQEAGIDHYHAWAFANLRQVGMACELAARFVQWLADPADDVSRSLVARHDEMSAITKALVLKGARSVMVHKPLDFAPLEALRDHWEECTRLFARLSV